MADFANLNKKYPTQILATVFCSLSFSAGAAEWSVEPSVSASATYSDNIRLLSQSTASNPIQANTIVSMSPALEFAHETEVRRVSGKARVAVNRYSKDSDLNANDAFFDISWREKGERSEFSMVSINAFDSTLATLLQDFGNPTERRQRQKISMNPTYAYNLDGRTTLALGYRYEDVSFRDSQNTGLVDFRSNELLPSLQYKLDELNELQLNTRLWQLITVPADLNISRSTFKSGLISALYVRALDESNIWSAGAGYYSINEDTTGNKNNPLQRVESHSGATALVRYLRKNEFNTISVTAAREINPSGENTLLLTNRLGMDFTQGLSPYLTAGVSLGVYKNSFIGAENKKSVEYFRASPSLAWKPAREWRLDAGIQYQRAKSTFNSSLESKANAKSAFLNLIYFWDKAAISR